MPYITQEYAVLINQEGGDNIIIKPNVTFGNFTGKYKVTAYCLIRDAETRKIITTFSPGQVLDGFQPKESLPTAPEAEQLDATPDTTPYDSMTKRELKDILISMERSYPSKATNKKLIELINA